MHEHRDAIWPGGLCYISEVAVHVFDRAARGPPLEIPLAELKTTV